MTFEIENVSKTFVSNDDGEEVHALKDINLTIETGKFVSLVGPSGCGKTTLLRIIEGFENPTEGTVKDNGEIVTEPSNERGFIFQNYSLYPWLNVIDNVIFGLDINGKPEKESKKRAMEYLKTVGLEDFAKRYPHELNKIRQLFSLHMILMKQYFYLMKLFSFPEDPEESRKFLKLKWSIREIERIKNLKS